MLNIRVEPKKFFELFRGRTDRVSIYTVSANVGKVVSLNVQRGEWEIIERIKSHLAGQARLGFYNMLPDFTVPWAVLDFDQKTGTTADPNADSILFCKTASKLGLREIKREKSKTKGGLKGDNYHCWIFFEKPIVARKIRCLLYLILKKLALPRIPVYPGQDELPPGSFGNFVFLPFFGGIDRWVTKEGEVTYGQGVRQGYTIFVDYEGNPHPDASGVIYRHSEEEIDNAIDYLQDHISQEPAPKVGLRVHENHVRNMFDRCEAFKNIMNEIAEKRSLPPDGQMPLAQVLKHLDHEQMFLKIMSRTAGYDPAAASSTLRSLTGRTFPTCGALKAVGYCPGQKSCFDKRAPLIERGGRWVPDSTVPNEQWRDASPVLFVLRSLGEVIEEPSEEVAVRPPEPIRAVAPLQTVSEEVDQYEKELIERRQTQLAAGKGFAGLSTGFDLLNQAIGGLEEGTLLILAGDAGCGKTAWARQLLDTVAEKEQMHCLYVSFDQRKAALLRKTLARISGIDCRKIKACSFNQDEEIRLRQALKKIKESFGKFVSILEGDETLTIKRILETVKNLNTRFLVIDPLQGIPPVEKEKFLEERARIYRTISHLRSLCRELSIPVLAVSNGYPKGENLEQMADICLYLGIDKSARPGALPGFEVSPGKEMMLAIEKHREGECPVAIKYRFFPDRQAFTEERKMEYQARSQSPLP